MTKKSQSGNSLLILFAWRTSCLRRIELNWKPYCYYKYISKKIKQNHKAAPLCLMQQKHQPSEEWRHAAILLTLNGNILHLCRLKQDRQPLTRLWQHLACRLTKHRHRFSGYGSAWHGWQISFNNHFDHVHEIPHAKVLFQQAAVRRCGRLRLRMLSF